MRCRVAGIILHNNHILLQGEPQGTFWTLPGGGIEPFEPSPVALQREIKEELGVDLHIERLLWITEEFFGSDDALQHQIAFYYLINLIEASHLYKLENIIQAEDGGIAIIFQWFPIAELTQVTLYPSFLPEALPALPLSPEHRVLIDDETTIKSQFED